MEIYEKQVLWKETSEKKLSQVRAENELAAEQEHSFAPRIYTVPVKPFEGPARELAEKSGKAHVERQMKARKDKTELNNKLGYKMKPLSIETPESYALESSVMEGHLPTLEEEPSLAGTGGALNHEAIPLEFSSSDEPIVELLERERKQWHEERMKLLHCIHLQQIELGQRSIAAHDRAADIAKEFARAIEGFEERLVSVETSVQREIMAIKSIAESLKASVATIQQSTGSMQPANSKASSNQPH